MENNSSHYSRTLCYCTRLYSNLRSPFKNYHKLLFRLHVPPYFQLRVLIIQTPPCDLRILMWLFLSLLQQLLCQILPTGCFFFMIVMGLDKNPLGCGFFLKFILNACVKETTCFGGRSQLNAVVKNVDSGADILSPPLSTCMISIHLFHSVK